MGAAKPVTDATFTREVLECDKPVVVDFWAEWCVPCRKIGAIIDQIAGTELGSLVVFTTMDTDANPETALRYQVRSVPTVTVFRSGEPVQSVSGARPKSELIRMIESALT